MCFKYETIAGGKKTRYWLMSAHAFLVALAGTAVGVPARNRCLGFTVGPPLESRPKTVVWDFTVGPLLESQPETVVWDFTVGPPLESGPETVVWDFIVRSGCTQTHKVVET